MNKIFNLLIIFLFISNCSTPDWLDTSRGIFGTGEEISKEVKNAIKQMDLLIKSKDKGKAKKYFPKFQSILMQVAKSGVVGKRTAARKISRISKKI